MSLAHRHPLKPFLSAEEPLLPEHSGKHDDRIAVSPRQLQMIGTALLVTLLLFVGSNYHRHFRRMQRHDLSSCSDRLAAMGLELSAASLSGSTAHQLPTPDGSAASGVDLWEYALQRHALYLDLATDMQRNGLVLGGIITQGLTQDELFELPAQPRRGAAVKPKLRHLDNPVRAAVLPLHDDEAAVTLHTTVQRALRGVVADSNVWWAPHDLLHTTLWHASTHKNPVEATPEQLAAERHSVAAVAASHCPIHAVLDRVVVSSSGVVMACWQVLPGSTEVAELRQALQAALPHAPPPEQQHVRYPAMLYTTVARLLGPARRPDTSWATGEAWDTVWLQSALVDVLADLSDDLCGLLTTFKEVQFVEEEELLALALNGHFRKHTSRLKCHKHAASAAAAA